MSEPPIISDFTPEKNELPLWPPIVGLGLYCMAHRFDDWIKLLGFSLGILIPLLIIGSSGAALGSLIAKMGGHSIRFRRASVWALWVALFIGVIASISFHIVKSQR